MTKHEEARELYKHLIYNAGARLFKNGVEGKSALQIGLDVSVKSLADMRELEAYIDKAEETERALTKNMIDQSKKDSKIIGKLQTTILKLEQDIKRYFELEEASSMTSAEVEEYADLYGKLSKVGKE